MLEDIFIDSLLKLQIDELHALTEADVQVIIIETGHSSDIRLKASLEYLKQSIHLINLVKDEFISICLKLISTHVDEPYSSD